MTTFVFEIYIRVGNKSQLDGFHFDYARLHISREYCNPQLTDNIRLYAVNCRVQRETTFN